MTLSETGVCVHSEDEPHHTEVAFCPLSVTHPPLAQALSYNLFGWLLSLPTASILLSDN